MEIIYLDPDNINCELFGPKKIAVAVERLLLSAYGDSYFDHTLGTKKFVTDLSDKIIDKEILPFLALSDDRIIGCSLLEQRPETGVKLTKGAVEADYRFRGIGNQLVGRQLSFIKKNRHDDLAHIEVRLNSVNATAVVLRNNFVPVGLWPESPVRSRGKILHRELILFAEYYLRAAWIPERIYITEDGLPWVNYISGMVKKGRSEKTTRKKYQQDYYDEKNHVYYFSNKLPAKNFKAAEESEVTVFLDVSIDTTDLQNEARRRGFAAVGFLPAVGRRPPQIIMNKGRGGVSAVLTGKYNGFIADRLWRILKNRRHLYKNKG